MVNFLIALKEIDDDMSQVNMRIGIHTGTIIGAIIGTDVIRYDIFGNDVLIGNKMESNGIPGEINISDNTKCILEVFNDELSFFPNKFVKINNEEIECFLLRKREES